jgi:hypothetical protein
MSTFSSVTAARLRFIPIGLLLAAGCGRDAESALPDGTAALGGFVVNLVPAVLNAAGTETAVAYTSVLGKVYDGPLPAATVWTVIEDAGGCQLSTPGVPYCSPGCGGGAVCVDGGRCVGYPVAQSLGRVHVVGLGIAAFDMDAISGNYQPATSVMLPFPPFQEGDVVRMTAPGGALGPISIDSRGIAPLVFDQIAAPVIGQPLKLTWTPPGRPELGRIELKLDISHHGGAKGKIECNVADTGSFEIPEAQITRLIALGVAGYPTIVLARVAAGKAALPAGVVTLRVLSTVERAVQIDGLRSCTTDNQCPAGMTCQTDLTCK